MTERQKALLELIQLNSNNNLKTSKREICDKLGHLGYRWNANPRVHDSCADIWNDVAEINLDMSVDKVIISKQGYYWIGTYSDTKEFLQRCMNDLLPRWQRYWAICRKIKYNGQVDLFSNKSFDMFNQ